MKKHAIVVYVDAENHKALEAVSPVVVGAFYAGSMGDLIPKAVVTSADQRTHLVSVSYQSMKSPKSFREANKTIKSGLNGDVIDKPKDSPPVWLLTGSGQFYRGDFVKVQDNEHLFLKLPEGDTMKFPLDKFSPGTRAYLSHKGEAKPEIEEKKNEFEAWTNTKGKAIQGKFISLANGKISLEKENGKVVVFDVSLLSKESQKRAKKLAGE